MVIATPELLGVELGRHERPRKSRGAPPKNAARAHYDQLMKQGMGNSEACRIVGISCSSGTRWRHVLKSGDTKKHAPISHQRPAVVSARFLSESEMEHYRGPVAKGHVADLVHCDLARTGCPIRLAFFCSVRGGHEAEHVESFRPGRERRARAFLSIWRL